MKILIQTQNPILAQSLKLAFDNHLESPNDRSADTEDSAAMLKAFAFDIAIVDHPAVKTIQALRRRKIDTPIIALCRGVADRVATLNAGADDALDHPAHLEELYARCVAVVRRWRGHAESIIAIGDLSVNIDKREAFIGATELRLTGTEYRILETMALRTPRAISFKAWHDLLYDNAKAPDSRVIDVFICKLRRKMWRASGGRDYIQNLWGRGHRLVSADECGAVQGSGKVPGTYREMAL